MDENNQANDLTRSTYNRRVARAAQQAALWASEAEDSAHYDINEAAGEAMNEVWGDDYRHHRGRILDYASKLPDDLNLIHDIYGPETTDELLNCIAREALKGDIDRLAWEFEDAIDSVRRRENELQQECMETVEQ